MMTTDADSKPENSDEDENSDEESKSSKWETLADTDDTVDEVEVKSNLRADFATN